MKRFYRVMFGLLIALPGCHTPQFPTVNIYDDPHRFVRLEVFLDDHNGEGYSHPAFISEETMAKVMRGLHVEIHTIMGNPSGSRPRAFSDYEVEFFAPLFVKGLSQATPEEVVTFFETKEISSLHEITTSGGVYVKGNAIHVLLSNYSTKTAIWHDNEEYQAPYHLEPLQSIHPQPGRLVFDPARFMAPQSGGGMTKALKGRAWNVAVLYKDLTQQ